MALLTVEGSFKNGRVELDRTPLEAPEEARVIVTFLPAESRKVEGGEDEAVRLRRDAAARMITRMRAGIDFGGERFNREELYEERLDRIARGNR